MTALPVNVDTRPVSRVERVLAPFQPYPSPPVPSVAVGPPGLVAVCPVVEAPLLPRGLPLVVGDRSAETGSHTERPWHARTL